MDTYDFTKGLDFTGLPNATAGDHNNLVDLAVPKADTDPSVGKSLNLVTKDTALDTPDVPDAATNTKWKRYQWIRRPHATATSRKLKAYAWNDDATSDPTYLKWLEMSVDISTLEADIIAAQTDATNALNQASSAASIANTALTQANTAITNANAALATANSAAANAATALADSAAANAAASAAAAAAAAAQTTANAAQVTASTAAANASAVANNKFYTSAAIPIATGTLVDALHNFGATPKFIRAVLICTADDKGYLAADNEEVAIQGTGDNSTGQIFTFGANPTRVFLYCSALTIQIGTKGTGIISAIDYTKWSIKLYAWA